MGSRQSALWRLHTFMYSRWTESKLWEDIIKAISPANIWHALSSCTNRLGIEDFFSGAVFVHSGNVSPVPLIFNRNKRNRRGLNMVNELAKKSNHDVQSTFRDIPYPNSPVQDAHNALAIHLVGTPHVPVDFEWYIFQQT
ncbi:hypothetical protein TNCV_2931671 [Trichonephila clavipes]|nr:hypothetical protein TNCV_2931671 [Trichonephila clavipes]